MERDFKTGEGEAMWVLGSMYSNSQLIKSEKPDILRCTKHNGTIEEGIEVTTCSRLDKNIQGKATYGINSLDFAKKYISSLKCDIHSPLAPKILCAINKKVAKWESGTYKECEIKSIAVVVTDFLAGPDQTVAMLLTHDNQSLAQEMVDDINAICRRPKLVKYM